ncbi:hypothetical protein [Synechococcus sp. MU1617]|uniref:hypothetical protein n=1 Tax=Synechococcus sp. MU1617 TaxID=2508346 RepID=UPI001CF82025|nr:hypothetical protein [Synechococcus sp. MU1617]
MVQLRIDLFSGSAQEPSAVGSWGEVLIEAIAQAQALWALVGSFNHQLNDFSTTGGKAEAQEFFKGHLAAFIPVGCSRFQNSCQARRCR